MPDEIGMAEPIHDGTFGRLLWDDLLSCWLGGIDWPPGLHTEVTISQLGGDVAGGLRVAREGLDWLKGTATEFTTAAGTDPKLAALKKEYERYFGTP